MGKPRKRRKSKPTGQPLSPAAAAWCERHERGDVPTRKKPRQAAPVMTADAVNQMFKEDMK